MVEKSTATLQAAGLILARGKYLDVVQIVVLGVCACENLFVHYDRVIIPDVGQCFL